MSLTKRLLDSDDRSVELHGVLGVLVLLTGLGLQVFDTVVLRNAFNMQSFGIGVGAVLTAVGGAGALLGLQRKAQGPPA